MGLTGRLSEWSGRNRWLIVSAWLAAVVVITGLSMVTGSNLTTDISFSNKPDAQVARELLEEARGAEPWWEQVIVQSDTYTVDDPQFRSFVDELTTTIRGLTTTVDPRMVFSFYDIGDTSLVSAGRNTTIILTLLVGDLDAATKGVILLGQTLHEISGRDGFLVVTGGFASVNHAFTEAAEEDLSSELKVLPVALLILILVFGAFVAAMLPMLIAFLAIGITFGLIALVTQIYEMSFFVTNVTLMIGLAVGIDYALVVIARFREQRRQGFDKFASIGIAGDTASRAVVFSGLTVVIALTGMFVVPTSIFRSFAIGASMVVLVTIVASLTLLPALLSLLGDRVNSLAIPFLGSNKQENDERGFWAGAARFVMRYPLIMAVVSGGALVIMTIPYFSIELGASGPASLPAHYDARIAFDILDQEFSAGRIQPSDIVVQAADVTAAPVQAALDNLMALVMANPTYSLVNGAEILRSDLALLQVTVPGDSASAEAVSAMKFLRSDLIPQAFSDVDARVYVGGPTAGNSDFFDVVHTYTPWVFAFVLSFSFVLLTLIFRSIVVPVKSIIINLLSVGASYGVVVAVFQWGWGADLLGFTQVDRIEAWLPLFMFTIHFGLSMDYHIFLLSRIRKRFDETRNNTESVAFGLRRTANIITGAAAIMVAVFGGFALGQLPMFQQIGLGLAVSVFLDATVVRTILVPATMRLLGDWNWYMPGWLAWLPDLRVEREPGLVAVGADDSLDAVAGGGA